MPQRYFFLLMILYSYSSLCLFVIFGFNGLYLLHYFVWAHKCNFYKKKKKKKKGKINYCFWVCGGTKPIYGGNKPKIISYMFESRWLGSASKA
jgi:hypothetical protein